MEDLKIFGWSEGVILDTFYVNDRGTVASFQGRMDRDLPKFKDRNAAKEYLESL